MAAKKKRRRAADLDTLIERTRAVLLREILLELRIHTCVLGLALAKGVAGTSRDAGALRDSLEELLEARSVMFTERGED